MTTARRLAVYAATRNGGQLTDRQIRRVRHKGHREGNGYTTALLDYAEQRARRRVDLNAARTEN